MCCEHAQMRLQRAHHGVGHWRQADHTRTRRNPEAQQDRLRSLPHAASRHRLHARRPPPWQPAEGDRGPERWQACAVGLWPGGRDPERGPRGHGVRGHPPCKPGARPLHACKGCRHDCLLGLPHAGELFELWCRGSVWPLCTWIWGTLCTFAVATWCTCTRAESGVHLAKVNASTRPYQHGHTCRIGTR